MAAVHESYLCHCQVPRLQRHLKQETGLCEVCGFIYDSQLYEMRLREHVENYTYEDLDEFLKAMDPAYAELSAH